MFWFSLLFLHCCPQLLKFVVIRVANIVLHQKESLFWCIPLFAVTSNLFLHPVIIIKVTLWVHRFCQTALAVFLNRSHWRNSFRLPCCVILHNFCNTNLSPILPLKNQFSFLEWYSSLIFFLKSEFKFLLFWLFFIRE